MAVRLRQQLWRKTPSGAALGLCTHMRCQTQPRTSALHRRGATTFRIGDILPVLEYSYPTFDQQYAYGFKGF
jgi:hypothetical protein